MLLSSDLVDAPYLLLSVCALFSASPLAAALLSTQVKTQHILFCVPQYKIQYHSHHFCRYYRDLTVPLSSASPDSVTIEPLNHHLIFDHVDLTYIHENRLVVGCV